MGDWNRVLEELKNPWDWAAGFIGGAAGATVTTLTHGGDLGHSIPTGILAAIGARRAGVATLQRRMLRKKATSLLEVLQGRDYSLDLVTLLQLELEKWDRKITDSDKFSKKIDEISELDSKRNMQRYLPPPTKD